MNSRSKFLLIALVLAAVATVVVAFTAQTSPQNSSADQKVNKEEPTLIQADHVSPQEKEHGKLFKHGGPKLLDLLAHRSGDIEVQQDAGLIIQTTASPERPVFLSAVCKADLVVTGSLVNKASQLTADGTFLFTDHQLLVDEVLKNNTAAPVAQGQTITVTRDGGVVQLNGRILRARPDFDVPFVGNRYLLFLRFIPATGSYLMYGNGAFELNSQSLKALGAEARQELNKAEQTEPASFIQQIRSFAATDCAGK